MKKQMSKLEWPLGLNTVESQSKTLTTKAEKARSGVLVEDGEMMISTGKKKIMGECSQKSP